MLIKLKFYFPEVVLGMMFAVALLAMGAVFFSSPNSGPPTQIQASTQSGEHGARNKQEITWWQDPIAIFTLGLVFIGVVHACIFYGQLRLIRRSLAPAEAAAKAAIVTAEHVRRVERGYIVGGGPSFLDGFGYIDIVNYGKTLAILTKVEWGFCAERDFPTDAPVSDLLKVRATQL